MRAKGLNEEAERILCEIEEFMKYDSLQGGFICIKRRKHGTTLPGQHIESVHNKGYRTVYANKKNILCHHLVWLWHHGKFPDDQIDHIDRDKSNNRIENLREVTGTINRRNVDLRRNNTSGYVGLKYFPLIGKWGAFIGNKYLGVRPTKEEAYSLRLDFLKRNSDLGYIENL